MSTNWNNFLRPFSSLLWTAVLLTIAITSATLSASWHLATPLSDLPLRNVVCESVFRIFGNLCNQGTRNISGVEVADVKCAACNVTLSNWQTVQVATCRFTFLPLRISGILVIRHPVGGHKSD
jgi:hypothetical protein